MAQSDFLPLDQTCAVVQLGYPLGDGIIGVNTALEHGIIGDDLGDAPDQVLGVAADVLGPAHGVGR
jgi:hypothetical protein